MIIRTDFLPITAKFLPMFDRWSAVISSAAEHNNRTENIIITIESAKFYRYTIILFRGHQEQRYKKYLLDGLWKFQPSAHETYQSNRILPVC